MAAKNTAIMTVLLASVIGHLLSDGELKRVRWIRAMRRCLFCLQSTVRYERVSLEMLLRRIDLRTTPQERQLTRLLHTCAERIHDENASQLINLFVVESAGIAGYGVLSHEDRRPFESVLCELGRVRLHEQLLMIEQADEQLRAREEELGRESKKRAHLIRMLSFSFGAALFLILI